MNGLKIPKIPVRLVALGLLGVALLLVGNALGAQKPTEKTTVTPQQAAVATGREAAELRAYQNALAFEAERVVSQIRGAGKVVVSVTTGGGPETIVAMNKTATTRRTEEKDSAGIARVTEEQNDSAQPVIARQSSAGDTPVVTRVSAPAIEGVVVVASGASDARVRAEIFKAVQVLFNVPAHRVRVLSMRVGE